ncbi:uncharacterized protein LOC111034846 isoform X2 [Myzus persicae]|uniref:uncharacterized protein LOC111034846 isoform X2 n=1 Tax=Myzus persicae TaxID=13164 RepID=UPI000B938A81|nr:uncharacterized protein LOC111034846 isoform X2 [Myzus persicae]
MIWYGYLYQIASGLLALWMLKVTYFFIKRRYRKSSVIDKNSAKENNIYTNSENVYNESSSESLNLENEKKMMDINNITACSGYSSTEDEMQESNNYTTSQDVSDTCKLKCDSHSSIISWESCNKEISHAESDVANSQSSETHTEICQPLDLCIRDKKNKTGMNSRTYFTDRKYKRTKCIQKVNSEKYSITETIEDYEQGSLNFEKMKDLDNVDNKEHSVNNDKLEYNLEITELSSIYHNEYSLDDTEHELKEKIYSEILELFSVDNDENSLDDTESELKVENNLEITELSSIHCEELEDKHSLDNTEHSLNNDEVMLGNDLETTRISPIYQDEQLYELNMETPEHSFINNDISISGIHSPNIKCNLDYEVPDSKGINITSSSECTESFPSPIFNNDSSIDDIRYVEDYNDISFFDPMLSDDALNEAFVEDQNSFVS